MIIKTEVDKYVDERGYVEFEISEDEKFDFDEWGFGAVIVKDIRNTRNSIDGMVLVCDYPDGDDFWSFGLYAWTGLFINDKYDFEYYTVKLPKDVEQNIKEQVLEWLD